MIRSLPWLLALCLVLLAAGPLTAQEPTPADTTRAEAPNAEMNMAMEGMMPMMSNVMRQVWMSSMQALADPETARNLAQFTRNYYNALVAQGFTDDQALQIVAGMGYPPLPSR